jgi:hypothetical protein
MYFTSVINKSSNFLGMFALIFFKPGGKFAIYFSNSKVPRECINLISVPFRVFVNVTFAWQNSNTYIYPPALDVKKYKVL